MELGDLEIGCLGKEAHSEGHGAIPDREVSIPESKAFSQPVLGPGDHTILIHVNVVTIMDILGWNMLHTPVQDVVLCNTVISCCEKSSQWSHGLEVLAQLQGFLGQFQHANPGFPTLERFCFHNSSRIRNARS